MSKERLVVIGGVAAGMSAASSYRRLKPEAEAIVLEKDFLFHTDHVASRITYLMR